MRRVLLAFVLIAALVSGCFLGLVTSTRVNTAAAMTYADGLDLQM